MLFTDVFWRYLSHMHIYIFSSPVLLAVSSLIVVIVTIVNVSVLVKELSLLQILFHTRAQW